MEATELNLDNLTTEEKEFKKALDSAGIPTTQDGLKTRFQEIADESELKITNTSIFSPFWCLIKEIATVPVYWFVCFLVKYVMPNLYIKTAVDKFLDILGYDRDIERQKAVKAQGNITFSRTSVSTPLVVPAGTTIRTVAINAVVYRVISNTDMNFVTGKKTLKVPCTAEKEGSAYNLATGYYSILEKEIPGVESVTNEKDWLTTPGDDAEPDDDFRKRMQNQFAAVGDWHIDSKYIAMITDITGLASDRIYFDHNIPRGPGSADAYILFDTFTPSEIYITAINHYIRDEGNHGHGDDMMAKALPEKKFDLEVTVYIASKVPFEQHQEILTELEQIVRCAFRENAGYTKYVTQTYPWARFAFSKLDEELHQYFPNVIGINWSIEDIVSEFWIARLGNLSIIEGQDTEAINNE